MQRVRDDGSLLPYEPASPTAVPPIDASAVQAITINDYWTGLSSAAPISAVFRLQPATDCFTGTAQFSVAAWSSAGAINRSVPITVPLPVMEHFLDLLESAPLDVETYKPVMYMTDSYPELTIAVRGQVAPIEFCSESQGDQHIPWRVFVRGQFVTYAGTPAQALDLLDPYLAREVEEEVIDQARNRE